MRLSAHHHHPGQGALRFGATARVVDNSLFELGANSTMGPPSERESGVNPGLPRSGKQERKLSYALGEVGLGSDGR